MPAHSATPPSPAISAQVSGYAQKLPRLLLVALRRALRHSSWYKVPSALFEDPAPSARLVAPRAQAASTHPRAQPEQLGGSRWPHEPVSGRPEIEDFPLSTGRHSPPAAGSPEWDAAQRASLVATRDARAPAARALRDELASATPEAVQAEHPG